MTARVGGAGFAASGLTTRGTDHWCTVPTSLAEDTFTALRPHPVSPSGIITKISSCRTQHKLLLPSSRCYWTATIAAHPGTEWMRNSESLLPYLCETDSDRTGNKSSGAPTATEGWAGRVIAKLVHGDRKEWATRHPQWKGLPHDDASSTGLSALFHFCTCWGLSTLGPPTGPCVTWRQIEQG